VSLLGSPLVRALPPLRVLDGVLATAVTGRDRTYLAQPCVQRRTFAVDTAGVGVTDFGITTAERARLVANGERAAAAFLARWDWEAYLRSCRGVTDPAVTSERAARG
jgi:NTE family protein